MLFVGTRAEKIILREWLGGLFLLDSVDIMSHMNKYHNHSFFSVETIVLFESLSNLIGCQEK